MFVQNFYDPLKKPWLITLASLKALKLELPRLPMLGEVQRILHVVIMRALFLVMVAYIVTRWTHAPSSYRRRVWKQVDIWSRRHRTADSKPSRGEAVNWTTCRVKSRAPGIVRYCGYTLWINLLITLIKKLSHELPGQDV